MEHLHYDTAFNERHNVTVKTWQDNGQWWEQTTVDGRVLSFQSFGPVDESEAS